jgi:hypothetical protein
VTEGRERRRSGSVAQGADFKRGLESPRTRRQECPRYDVARAFQPAGHAVFPEAVAQKQGSGGQPCPPIEFVSCKAISRVDPDGGLGGPPLRGAGRSVDFQKQFYEIIS